MNRELEEAYPECRNAIELMEAGPGERTFASARAAGMGVDQVIFNIVTGLKRGLQNGMANGTLKVENLPLVARAVPEMGTPAFRRYIAAKLGLL